MGPGPPGARQRPSSYAGTPLHSADVFTDVKQATPEPEPALQPVLEKAYKHLYAVVELSCCLHKFINIEMRSQGWYALRVKLQPNPRIKAVWTYTHSLDCDQDEDRDAFRLGAEHMNCVQPPDCDQDEDSLSNSGSESSLRPPTPWSGAQTERGWSFRSKAFRIKYCYDSVVFKDAVPCFQIFVRQPYNLSNLDLTVKVELVAQLLKPTESDVAFRASDLRPVASEVLRLRGVTGGLLAYQPISFGVDHWGLAHVLFGSALVGFATRSSMHSMSWAVGRDLRRPRGGKPRRPRRPLSSSYPPHTRSAHQLSPSLDSPSAASSPRHGDPPWASQGGASGMMPGTPRSESPGLGDASECTSDKSPSQTLNSALSFNSVLTAGAPSPAKQPQGAKSGAPAAHSSTSQPLSLIQALRTLLHALPAARPHPAPTHAHGRHCVSYNGAAGNPWPHNQQCQTPTTHPTLPETVQWQLERLYGTLVTPLCNSTRTLSSTLRLLPTSCYAPQTYETMKALLVSLPCAAQRAYSRATRGQLLPSLATHADLSLSSTGDSDSQGSPVDSPGHSVMMRQRTASHVVHARQQAVSAALGLQAEDPTPQSHRLQRHTRASDPPLLPLLPPIATARSRMAAAAHCVAEVVAADVASWPELPEAHAFVSCLPLDCDEELAIMYLHAVLARQMRTAATEWGLLQWLMDTMALPLTAYLRCHWEMDQPQTTATWAMMVSDFESLPVSGPRGFSVAQLANKARSRLSARPSISIPRVHHARVWDRPHDQPVLVLDDSLGTYMGSHRMSAAGGPRLSSAGQVRPEDILLGKRVLEARTDMEAAPVGMKRPTASGSGAASLVPCLMDPRKVHLVVFVHGYQGAPTDLGPIKAHIHALNPMLECRFSAANEGRTDEDLETLGDRLADECLDWIAKLGGERASRLGACEVYRLSFVGHSLGVMITRAALASPKMQHLLPRLWLLLSLGGPLLGQLYSNNTLVSAGLGVLKAFKNGGCLHQMDMKDSKGGSPESSWLYKFTTRAAGSGGSLQAFQRVVLVASEQDRYVPHHSAELCWCDAAVKDRSWRGKAYRDMLAASIQGFGASPDAPQLLRVGVHFSDKPMSRTPSSSFLSDMLGRTAHVALIESDDFARLLAWGVVQRFGLFGTAADPAWL